MTSADTRRPQNKQKPKQEITSSFKPLKPQTPSLTEALFGKGRRWSGCLMVLDLASEAWASAWMKAGSTNFRPGELEFRILGAGPSMCSVEREKS